MEEFLTFDKVDETKFLIKTNTNPEVEEEKDVAFDNKLENKISSKYNRDLKYPWM
jgi:hypothetical protein